MLGTLRSTRAASIASDGDETCEESRIFPPLPQSFRRPRREDDALEAERPSAVVGAGQLEARFVEGERANAPKALLVKEGKRVVDAEAQRLAEIGHEGTGVEVLLVLH